MVRHHFTVDVEEYFQVSAFETSVGRADWDRFELRGPLCLSRILQLLSNHGARGTFFILGWVADRLPEMVREIADEGHEIASHGWDHRRVTTQRPDEFRQSVRRTKCELEDLTGVPVLGFRAPSYSIVPGYEWALDILIEEGYQYDSSLFPVRRPGGYGYPDGERHPHRIERPGGSLLEIPPMTLRRFGVSIPAGGGAYFRVFPYGLVHAAFKDCERDGVPGTFYVHPWELDPAQPRISVPWLSHMRHYTGLERTQPRLERLLRDFRFTTIADTVAAL
jgi:polysaccharide deacetylase family protein (PEP-CTERM system associated)